MSIVLRPSGMQIWGWGLLSALGLGGEKLKEPSSPHDSLTCAPMDSRPAASSSSRRRSKVREQPQREQAPPAAQEPPPQQPLRKEQAPQPKQKAKAKLQQAKQRLTRAGPPPEQSAQQGSQESQHCACSSKERHAFAWRASSVPKLLAQARRGLSHSPAARAPPPTAWKHPCTPGTGRHLRKQIRVGGSGEEPGGSNSDLWFGPVTDAPWPTWPPMAPWPYAVVCDP